MRKMYCVVLVMIVAMGLAFVGCNKEKSSQTSPVFDVDDSDHSEAMKDVWSSRSITTPREKGYVFTKIKFSTWYGAPVCTKVKITFGSWNSGERQVCPYWNTFTFVVRSTHSRDDKVNYTISTTGTFQNNPRHSRSSSDWQCPATTCLPAPM